jgi:hypothetical protein
MIFKPFFRSQVSDGADSGNHLFDEANKSFGKLNSYLNEERRTTLEVVESNNPSYFHKQAPKMHEEEIIVCFARKRRSFTKSLQLE